MKKLLCLLTASLLSLPYVAQAQIPETTQQLIVVTTANWTDIQGTAQRYERQGATFEKAGEPFPIVVGKTGLAWGRGLTKIDAGLEPVKREGDGKAPAGLFSLGTAFGYGASADTRLDYLALTPTSECVDDSNSAAYNTLVDGQQPGRDWHSSEMMRRADDLYRNGIFVDHNTPATASAGSCIFLHLWRAADEPTAGCTAMAPESMNQLFAWLDPSKQPVLVQLPKAEYQHYRKRWNLPAL